MYSRSLTEAPAVPSITTVIAQGSTSLDGWHSYMAASAVVKHPGLPGAIGNSSQLRTIVQEASRASERYRDAAAERGTRVHYYCEQVALRALEQPNHVAEARSALAEHGEHQFADRFDEWWQLYQVEPVAAEITGPYRDWSGHLLTEAVPEPGAVGTKILGSYGFPGDTQWLAPGHNSVFADSALTDTASADRQEADEYFMVHHVRFAEDPSQHTAHLRRLYFTAGGWPVVSPQPFAGRESERLPEQVGVDGSWLVAQLDPLSSEPVSARRTTLASPELPASDGTPSTARVLVDGTEIDAVVFAGQDWARGCSSLCFSGIDSGGTAWFGTREGES